MLPRNGGGVKGHGRADSRLDSRKIILGVLALVFVAYFAVVNMYFSLPSASSNAIVTNGAAAHEKHEPVAAAAATLAVEEEEEATEPPVKTVTPKPMDHAWIRKPNRQYVWLDVAIDDVFIGRVTAEVSNCVM